MNPCAGLSFTWAVGERTVTLPLFSLKALPQPAHKLQGRDKRSSMLQHMLELGTVSKRGDNHLEGSDKRVMG